MKRNEHTFSVHRYNELKAFCRQYPDKKREYDGIPSPHSSALNGMPHLSGIADPVLAMVSQRMKLGEELELIEGCAMDVRNGDFYHALIANICYDKPYDCILELVPTINRNAYFAARSEFFELLHLRKITFDYYQYFPERKPRQNPRQNPRPSS